MISLGTGYDNVRAAVRRPSDPLPRRGDVHAELRSFFHMHSATRPPQPPLARGGARQWAVSWCTGCRGGTFHFPLIASSFGQYSRMAQANGPAGAGSQFDSWSARGESASRASSATHGSDRRQLARRAAQRVPLRRGQFLSVGVANRQTRPPHPQPLSRAGRGERMWESGNRLPHRWSERGGIDARATLLRSRRCTFGDQ